MEPDWHIIVLIFFVVLSFLSAFFSGSESALLSLSDSDRSELQKGTSKQARRFEKLFSNPKVLTLSLKLAVFTVNTAMVCSTFYLLTNYLPGWRFGLVLVAVLVVVATFLFITKELLSKIFVLKHNRMFAGVVSNPILMYVQLVKPLTGLIATILTHLSSRFNVVNKGNLLEHRKIISIVDNGQQMDDLEASERAMINSIVTFGETEVHEIMVPRTDMVCLAEDASLEELTNLIKDKGHTRIPLYSDGIDHILGIFHAKNLLQYVMKTNSGKIDLKALARPAYFVPETKKVHLQLKEFQREKYHMAIVVDEYGGTAGLVTLEDVLEEIVGEIQDEYDEELPLYRKLDDNTFMVDAKIDLHELNAKLELDLPTEGEYDSLGGFILSLTGYVPEEKEVVKYHGYAFTVEQIERNRIVQVKLQRSEQNTEPDANEQDG